MLKEYENALGAQVGDQVKDAQTGKIGIVTWMGAEGNYDVIYVNFGRGKYGRKIIPMDDAQIEGRYHLLKEI